MDLILAPFGYPFGPIWRFRASPDRGFLRRSQKPTPEGRRKQAPPSQPPTPPRAPDTLRRRRCQTQLGKGLLWRSWLQVVQTSAVRGLHGHNGFAGTLRQPPAAQQRRVAITGVRVFWEPVGISDSMISAQLPAPPPARPTPLRTVCFSHSDTVCQPRRRCVSAT